MRIAVVAPSSRFSEEAAGRVTAIAARSHPAVGARLPPAMLPRPQSFRRRRDAAVRPCWSGGERSRLRCGLVRARRLRLVPDRGDGDRRDWRAARRGPRPGSAIATRASCSPGSTAPAFRTSRTARCRRTSCARAARRRSSARWPGLPPTRRTALEAGLAPGRPHAAFNITVLGHLLGTPLEPDLAGHILLLEEVSEHLYAFDRAMFHISASANRAPRCRHPARPGQRRSPQRSRFRRG